MFGSLGMPELVVIFVIALIVCVVWSSSQVLLSISWR